MDRSCHFGLRLTGFPRRQGNDAVVRRTAFDCVLACQPPAQWLLKHIKLLFKRDPSLDFRRHITQGLADSWLMAFAFGEMDGLHDPTANDKTRDLLKQDPDAFLDADIAQMRQAMAASDDLRKLIASLIRQVSSTLQSVSLLTAVSTIVIPKLTWTCVSHFSRVLS